MPLKTLFRAILFASIVVMGLVAIPAAHAAQLKIQATGPCSDTSLASAAHSNGPVTITALLMAKQFRNLDTGACEALPTVYAEAIMTSSTAVSGTLTAYWWNDSQEFDHKAITVKAVTSALVKTSTHNVSCIKGVNQTNAEAGWTGTDPVAPFHTADVCLIG